MLVAGAAVLAHEAVYVEDSWTDVVAQEIFQENSLVAATSFSGVPDQTPVSLLGELPEHNASVGTLNGSAEVSGGAAAYTIPIVVPPGRRGMQPQLALSYSSRGGNDIAGMGWSLSGGSSISRCPSTLAQDGVIRAVDLSASDKLCLEGQRLVLTSGSYGQAGATYDTELTSFSRVTQLSGSLSSSTTYFKVEAKSGEIRYYGGNTAAASTARVIPGGVAAPMVWLLERQQDRVGNMIRYQYTSYGNGENLLSSVMYTGFGTTDGDRKVELSYEVRPTSGGANDQSSSYLAGGLTRQTQRLAKVLTSVGSQSVREYRLAYVLSAATGRSLLTSVTECGFSDNTAVCRNPTTFAWQSGAIQHRFRKLELTPGTGLPSNMKWEFSTSAGGGDFNGDGTHDVFGVGTDPATPSVKRGYLLTLSPERQVVSAIEVDPDSSLRAYGKHGDFDLDGRTDVVSQNASDQVTVSFWHGPQNAASTAAALTDTWNTGINVANGGIEHVGDMDADGKSDLLVNLTPANPTDSCRRLLELHLNRSTPGSIAFTKLPNTMCLKSVTVGGILTHTERIERITDLDGDGLPEIVIRPNPYNGTWLDTRTYFGCRGGALCSSAYTLLETPHNGSYAASDPRAGYVAKLKAGIGKWRDINGDGLDDFEGSCHLNTGKGFVPCTVSGTISAAPALEIGRSREAAADVDGDGRAESLLPRRYAARYCQLHIPDCPIGDDRPACEVRYACPEDLGTGTLAIAPRAIFGGQGDLRVAGMYDSGLGDSDSSLYYLNSVRLVETGSGQFRQEELATTLVAGLNANMSDDLFGDGLVDGTTRANCLFSDLNQCAVPTADIYGNPIPESDFPRALPDGSPLLSGGIFINENMGPGGQVNPDGITPQTPDLMAMVTDGLGSQTVWTYYPLSSKAGRGPGETPLYSIPANTAARYIDDRHFYFTSSMPVVAEMSRSDGIGGYRTLRYGYSEAMYHAQGRGFQGFRTIIEEDETTGTRTTTTFHQKFPLTSQPESILVNSIKRSGIDAPITKQLFTWRCNRANRADTSACSPSSGSTAPLFPFLDIKETWTYDAAMADDPTGGVPGLLSYSREMAADTQSCSSDFSTISGYDAYGNLTASNTVVVDGSGSGGFRTFVAAHRTCTRSTFLAADTTNWWLDKLSARTVTTSIAHSTTNHALPAGVANPAQTVVTQYTWNSNRTPATETLQAGVANQQRVTTYGYPTPSYGLPNSVTVNGSGDPNGNRTTSTTYSSDGYFPQTVTNPLGHSATMQVRSADGQPIQVTDANGLRTTTTYDAFGFATTVQYRGATDGEYVAPDRRASLSWCGSCLSPGKFRHVVVQDGAPTSIEYFDNLSRPVGRAQKLADGTYTYLNTVYDNAGRVSAQSEPYRSGQTVVWTLFTGYDLLGRVLQKVTSQANYDGRGDRVTSYAYTGRTTTIQVCGSNDPDTSRCLSMSRTTDSLGRFVETVDANGGMTKFWHDPSDNALAIRDAKGGVISASYNAIGQRTSVSDPNQGAWSFGYDALGDVLSQTDARGIVTTTSYDKLGRPTQASASFAYDDIAGADAVTDTWTYDPAYAKGKEGTRTRRLNTSTVLRKVTTTYDMLSRPIGMQYEQVGNATPLLQEIAYDVYYGRPKAQSFGNGEAVWLRYSNYGHLIRESDANNGNSDYRRVNNVDSRGNVTAETLAGGSITTWRNYRAETGQQTSVIVTKAGTSLRRLDYQYDVFGNLIRQALNTTETVEAFTYDALHRLTEASRTGAATGTVDYAYDAVGNFTSKSDFSTTAATAYAYTGGACGGGPNAVKSVALKAGGTRTYCYDATGNLTADNAGLAAVYDHTQRPLKIARGAVISRFDYDSNGERIRQTGVEAIQYFPGIERRFTAEKTYVGSAAVVTTSGSTRSMQYLLTDRLGSVVAIADASGNLVETRGYDAFGKPRTGTWADATRLATVNNTPHGFTGHEHLNQLELIHMNGRVYDYNLGRFTGVDPVIQFPLNSQSLNPYSYILNNPLSGTDPTGYSCEAATGTHIKSCETITATEVNEDGSKGESRSSRENKGTLSAYVASRTKGDGSNGASAQGPTGAGSRSDQSASAGEKGSSANGADAGYYSVSVDAEARTISGYSPVGAGDIPNGATVFVNGILQEFDAALRTGAEHVSQLDGRMSDFYVAYNPTVSFTADAIEAGRDIFASMTGVGHSQLAKNLGSAMLDAQASGRDWRVIGHSQGGAILASSIRYANGQAGSGALSGMEFSFHGAPINNHVARRLSNKSGGAMLPARAQYSDFVHVVLGFNSANPFRYAASIASSPRLFRGPNTSPHTYPCGPAGSVCH